MKKYAPGFLLFITTWFTVLLLPGSVLGQGTDSSSRYIPGIVGVKNYKEVMAQQDRGNPFFRNHSMTAERAGNLVSGAVPRRAPSHSLLYRLTVTDREQGATIWQLTRQISS